MVKAGAMAKKYVLLALSLMLVQVLVGGLAAYSQQYRDCNIVLGDKPVSIVYEVPEALVAGKLALIVQDLKYSLSRNSYFIVMAGLAPSDLYGFAIIVYGDSIEYYLIRGSQNEWFKINRSVEGNVSVTAELVDKYVNVSIYVNNTLVLSLRRDAGSISLKTLVLSLGNVAGINTFTGNVYFKSLNINVDGEKILNFTNTDDAYMFLVENTSITPSQDRVRLLCNYINYTTATITETHVLTTAVTNTTTFTTTLTITVTNTSVIPITKTITMYENITRIVNKTLTLTVSSTYSRSMIVESAPWHVVITVIAFVVAVVISLIVILRR